MQDLVSVGVRWLTLLEAIRTPPSRLHSVSKEVGTMIQLARRDKTVLRIPLHDTTTPAVIVHRGADPHCWTGKMAVAALMGPK
jgi:hypothetical protein